VLFNRICGWKTLDELKKGKFWITIVKLVKNTRLKHGGIDIFKEYFEMAS